VDKPTRSDEEVDWLVFGSGAAGLCAALVGRLEGLNVLLCEKTPLIGGTTAPSGGTIWILGSHQSQLTPTPDDLDSARRYLEGELGNATAHLNCVRPCSPVGLQWCSLTGRRDIPQPTEGER
jgi:glycine/D-amino acid oxidase-like deaminating enzyme